MLGEAAGGAQAANVFLQQPGLPSLQHLTRLVLSTTFHRSFFMFDAEAGGLRSAPGMLEGALWFGGFPVCAFMFDSEAGGLRSAPGMYEGAPNGLWFWGSRVCLCVPVDTDRAVA